MFTGLPMFRRKVDNPQVQIDEICCAQAAMELTPDGSIREADPRAHRSIGLG